MLLVVILIFLLVWEWLVWFMGWPHYKIAAPSDIWRAFWRFCHLFFRVWLTDIVADLGWAQACDREGSTVFGIVIGFSRMMGASLYPLLVRSMRRQRPRSSRSSR